MNLEKFVEQNLSLIHILIAPETEAETEAEAPEQPEN